MNLFSSKTAKEAADEKREALCTIIISQLQDAHLKEVKEIKESEAFKNFEANLLKTDKEAAQLNSAIRALETALSNMLKSLEGTDHYETAMRITRKLSNTRLNDRYNRYVSDKKEETFPKAYRYYNLWAKRDLIESYLRVYEDLKNTDKIVEKVLERLN